MLITTLDGDNLDALSSVVLSLFTAKNDEASFVVLVPSFSSKMWLRRLFTKQSVKLSGSAYPIDLSIFTLEEFASEYGLPDLVAKGLMQCPTSVLAAIVASDQLERGRVLDPQVLSFLIRSINRLMLLRDEDLELLLEAGAPEEIVALTEKVRSLTLGRYFNFRTLLESAISTWSSNPSNRIVILGTRLFGDSSKVFWELLNETPVHVEIEQVITNTSSTSHHSKKVLYSVPQDTEGREIQISGGLTLLEELKGSTTFIISRVREGHPPSKMGLLFAQPNLYLPYWEILSAEMSDLRTGATDQDSEEVELSEVSLSSLFNTSQLLRLRQLPAGQLLQSLLIWIDSDFSRVEFVDHFPGVLASINGAGPDECRSFEFWDLITTEANIYRGRQEWQTHLRSLKQSWDGSTRPIYLGGRTLNPYETEAVLKQLSDLSTFIDRTFELFDRLQGATFATMADAVVEYTRELLRPVGVTTLPFSIPDGFDNFIEFANELSTLDSLTIAPSFDSFRMLLQHFLEMHIKTSTNPRQLVTVAPLMSTLGTSFDYLAVVGLNDKLASLGGNTSSSFDDFSVTTLGLPLLTSKEFGDRALAHLATLVESSRGVLVTFDNTKVGTTGEVSESISQLLEAMGDRCKAVNVNTSATKQLTKTGNPLQPLSVKELVILIDEASQLLELEATNLTSSRLLPTLSSIREVERRFKTGEMEEGLDLDYIDLIAISKNARLRDFPIQQGRLRLSPSQLEAYVKCPYAFFINSILGASSPVRPEDALYMSPQTMGELVHAVMEQTLRQVRATCDATHNIASERLFEEADRLLRLRFDDLVRTGRAGRRAFESINFDKANANVRRLLKILTSQVYLSSDTEIVTELRFDDIDPAKYFNSVIKKIPVGFTGKVDLVADQNAQEDRQLLVVDYKTGSIDSYKGINDEAPTAQGNKFQLFIYALAVAKLFQVPVEAITTKYWFSSVFSGQKEIEVSFTPDTFKAAWVEVEKVLNLILQGAYMGRPSPNPAGHGSCEYCNPKGLQNTSLERVWLWHLSNLLNASISLPNDWLDKVEENMRREGST